MTIAAPAPARIPAAASTAARLASRSTLSTRRTRDARAGRFRQGNDMHNLKFAAIGTALLAGCSTQQAYYSAQQYERNQCERMLDQGARERCLANAAASYEGYKRRAE
jgi:hypothetical protein